MKAGMELQIQTNHQAVEENMSNLTSASAEATPSSVSSINTSLYSHHPPPPPHQPQQHPPLKRKRNLPGNPDPEAEVIALSPHSLLATNRFVCEICNKGFQRDQNLQLHKRGHNLPWKLKVKTSQEVKKKVYVCPETSCVHHSPSRALGDLTGIKKHFSRKHGEKKWKCEKCSKRYAVKSDWKAHNKVCGTKEYRCDCGTIFSRRDSFITHRAFCDALAEESSRAIPLNSYPFDHHQVHAQFNRFHQLKTEQESFNPRPEIPPWLSSCPAPPQVLEAAAGRGPPPPPPPPEQQHTDLIFSTLHDEMIHQRSPISPNPSSSLGPTTNTSQPYSHQQPIPSHHMSATALLQKAAQMGAKISSKNCSSPAAEMMVVRPHFGDHVSASFGLNLSSMEEEDNHSHGIATARTSLFQEMMNSSSSLSSSMMGYSLSSFGDGFGGGMMSLKKEDDEGMTRDFLSLKPLSQRDILSFGGFGDDHVSDGTHENDHSHGQHSWQG